LGLPLRIRNRSIGLLEVYGPEDLLEEDTVDILGSMTSQAASALENARLYGELAEREKRLEDLVGKLLAAQEEERRRVAYEVHDGLAQVAVAAHQRLQAFSRRHPPQTERGGRDLQRVARLVRQTVSDARKIIANLRPTVLDDFGLAAAVSLEIERLREDGYQVDYEEELGDERLPDTVEISLFRIAQEALTNVHKHARTEKIRVELRRRRGEVCLEVRDYGRGFDPTARPIGNGPGERVGVAGMQERIGMLGGEFEIRSKPGEGTSVIVTLPVYVEEA
jgi:signal transduction histidine kinase